MGAWVQVTDNVDGALLARIDVANGYRGWDLSMKGSRAGLQIISSWNQDALRVIARGSVSSEGWHHVFVTYDGSRKAKGVRIYYDGKPQSVYEEVDSLRGSIRTKTPLRLNRRSTGEGAGGEAVHDVRFYRRVLTTPEVQVLARRVDARDGARRASGRADAEDAAAAARLLLRLRRRGRKAPAAGVGDARPPSSRR